MRWSHVFPTTSRNKRTEVNRTQCLGSGFGDVPSALCWGKRPHAGTVKGGSLWFLVFATCWVASREEEELLATSSGCHQKGCCGLHPVPVCFWDSAAEDGNAAVWTHVFPFFDGTILDCVRHWRSWPIPLFTIFTTVLWGGHFNRHTIF